jgi:hypothetical protein
MRRNDGVVMLFVLQPNTLKTLYNNHNNGFTQRQTQVENQTQELAINHGVLR